MQPYRGGVGNVTRVEMQTGLPLRRAPWKTQVGAVEQREIGAANESSPLL